MDNPLISELREAVEALMEIETMLDTACLKEDDNLSSLVYHNASTQVQGAKNILIAFMKYENYKAPNQQVDFSFSRLFGIPQDYREN